eukprot:g25646.t1
MKDVPGVFVNVTLQIQNFFIPGCLGKAASQSIDISLEGLPGFVGVNLSLAKQKRSDLIKVLKVQALVQIRKGLKSFGGTPGFPNGMNMDANGDLLFHMERQMLEATEDGPCLSSFARDNPFEGSFALPRVDVVHGNHKDISLVPYIFAGLSHSQGESMASRNSKGVLWSPDALSDKDFLHELNKLGLSKLYDFAYLPRDFNAVDNKGYAFVNFVSPETAQMFRRRVQESGFLSTIKAPVVADAVVQGLDANLKTDRARRKWCGQRLNRIRNPELKPYVSPEALQSMGQRESSAAFSTTARQIKAQQIGEVAVLKARVRRLYEAGPTDRRSGRDRDWTGTLVPGAVEFRVRRIAAIPHRHPTPPPLEVVAVSYVVFMVVRQLTARDKAKAVKAEEKKKEKEGKKK